MSRLLVLYPSAWRERYEAEMRDLLEARPPTLGDRLDLVRGALDARLHPQVAAPRLVRDGLWRLAAGGLGLFVVAVGLAATGPEMHDEYGTYRDGGAAVPFALAAFGLLAIGLARLVKHLPASAVAARRAGYVAMATGLVWAAAPWMYVVGLAFVISMSTSALGLRRAGLMPSWLALALVAALAIPGGLYAAIPFQPWWVWRMSGLSPFLLYGPMAVPFVAVALSLLRGLPPRPLAPSTAPAGPAPEVAPA